MAHFRPVPPKLTQAQIEATLAQLEPLLSYPGPRVSVMHEPNDHAWYQEWMESQDRPASIELVTALVHKRRDRRLAHDRAAHAQRQELRARLADEVDLLAVADIRETELRRKAWSAAYRTESLLRDAFRRKQDSRREYDHQRRHVRAQRTYEARLAREDNNRSSENTALVGVTPCKVSEQSAP